MIIELTSTTADGRKTKVNTIKVMNGRTPEWSEMHKRWYVAGYRFIRTTNKFSGSALVHNGQMFIVVEE